MKRITFSIITLALLVIGSIYASEKATQPVSDSTYTIERCDAIKTNIKSNLDALDDKFFKTLNKEQRGILDQQKVLTGQYQAIEANADSTMKVKK
jgi:hypothetical protein